MNPLMPAGPESARLFLARLVERVRRLPSKKRIVFPEGGDARVRAAAARLKEERLLEPILLDAPLGRAAAEKLGALFYERRRAKGVTQMEAVEAVRNPLYGACMMVAAGLADGAVGGAVNTTAETVRAALASIGLAAGIRTVCGVFFVCVQDRAHGHDGVLAFADCAVVIDPTAVQVAEIALATAGSTRAIVGAEARVALLSFSTKGSAKHPYAEKMIEAMRILRERAPELEVDGELQADAALVAEVGASKAPGSRVAGEANTLIFPDLASANLSYKLVERLGGAAAYGPLLRGLAKPVSDLSRGCSAEDIYAAAIMTALQAEEVGARVLPFKVIYHDGYDLNLGEHVFPSRKYRMVRDRLMGEGVAEAGDIVEPEAASDEDMLRVHSREWIGKLQSGFLDYLELARLEIPYSRKMVEAFWLATGGTMLAARLAVTDGVGFGIAINLGGGFHHAYPNHGEGFCAVNDIAVAIRAVQAEGVVERAMVIDADVHHGNGTAAIFAGDASVFTLSIHQFDNYPSHKPPSTMDVHLPDGVGDEGYLARLRDACREGLAESKPQLVMYVAGADPYREDKLGGLKLTMEGLKARDRMVFEMARGAGAGVAVVLAGGYAREVEDTVSIHCNTVRAAVEACNN